jgi:hypothetical protein
LIAGTAGCGLTAADWFGLSFSIFQLFVILVTFIINILSGFFRYLTLDVCPDCVIFLGLAAIKFIFLIICMANSFFYRKKLQRKPKISPMELRSHPIMKSRSTSKFLVEELSPGDFFDPAFTKAVVESLVKEPRQLQDFSPILKSFLTTPIQQMAALDSMAIRLKMDAYDGFRNLLEEFRSFDLISDDAILKWSCGK